MKTKKCNRCGKVLPVSKFAKRQTKKTLVSGKIKTYVFPLYQCKECLKKTNVERYHKKYKENYYLKKYNLTFIEIKKMIKKQNGKCLICKQNILNDYNIDHDHKTGKVRGILCSSCNQGLGNFKDNVNNLQKAVSYLEKRERL